MKSDLDKLNGALSEVLDYIIFFDVKQATKYLSPKKVVRATRRQYGKVRWTQRDPIEVLVTIGRPNYRERLFIKDCKKAGESFPVERVQLKRPQTERGTK